jgi:hypothetical protein
MAENDFPSKDLAPYSTPIPPISVEIVNTLIEKAPQEALQLAKEYIQQQTDLAKSEIENHQKLKIAGERTKRLGMGLIFATIVAVMVYSGFTKDKDLSEKIIDVAIGALGGLGAGVVLLKKKEED